MIILSAVTCFIHWHFISGGDHTPEAFWVFGRISTEILFQVVFSKFVLFFFVIIIIGPRNAVLAIVRDGGLSLIARTIGSWALFLFWVHILFHHPTFRYAFVFDYNRVEFFGDNKIPNFMHQFGTFQIIFAIRMCFAFILDSVIKSWNPLQW